MRFQVATSGNFGISSRLFLYYQQAELVAYGFISIDEQTSKTSQDATEYSAYAINWRILSPRGTTHKYNYML